MYGDEVTPGVVLAARHDRKFWAIYASLQEFGPLTLSNEKAWFTILTLRTILVNQASAGCSQVFKILLKDLFCMNDAVDPRAGGMFLRFPDGRNIRLFVHVRIFLLDGDAHRALWCSKGEGGMKPTFLWANMFTKRSEISVGSDELVLATDESVLAAADRLGARKPIDSDELFR